MNSDTLKPIIATIVRAFLIWFLGFLGAKSPTLYNLVNRLIGTINGGVETLVYSITGLLLVTGIAIWARLWSKFQLHIALAQPKGTSLETVKQISKTAPVSAVLTQDVSKVVSLILAAAIAGSSLLGLAACQTTGPGGSSAIVSKDPVVNAEKLTVIAEATLNTLFTLEKQNRSLVLQYAPEVHRQVDNLRRAVGPTGQDGLTLLERMRTVTKAYEANSSADNLVSLQAVTATLTAVLSQAQQFQSQINTLTKKTP